MNKTSTMKPPNQKYDADLYMRQKILSASPQQLVAYIYDSIIASCVQRDKEKALRATQELIDSLDFEKGKPVARTFYRIYRYLLDQLRKDNFDEVKSVVSEIRQTWVKAMKVY